MTTAMSRPPDKSLGRAALSGGVLVGATQAVKIAGQFLSLILLARLLTPVDFGIAAAAAPVLSLVALVQDFGLSQAIVQRQDLVDDDLDRIFWALVGLGSACALAVAAVSPAVAWLFGDPRLTAFCMAAGPSVLISSLATLPLGLLMRDLRFGVLAGIDTTASVCGLLLAVVAAWAGAGYWSLLISSAAVTGLTAIGAWRAANWRPRRPDWHLPHRSLMAFGGHLTGFNFVNFFARNLDNLLIGRVWGLAQLGYYDRAYRLLLFPLQGIVWPFSRVMIPLLSRVQGDPERLREIYLRAAGILALVTAPALAAAAAAPTEVVALLFGQAWQPMAPILFWLSLAGLVQPLSSSSGWLFIACGRTDAMFRCGVINSLSTIVAFCVGLRWGAVGIAAAYAVAEYAVHVPVQYWWLDRLGLARARDLLKVQVPLLGAAALTVPLTRNVLRGGLALHGVALLAAAVAVAYLAALGCMCLFAENRRRIRAGAVLMLCHGSAVAGNTTRGVVRLTMCLR